jgi:hypothetical protein
VTKYKVVGQCEVAGTQPGATVSQEALVEVGANVDALIAGGHLEEVKAPAPAAKAKDGA